jgi:hypothetical protein
VAWPEVSQDRTVRYDQETSKTMIAEGDEDI